MVVAVAYEVEPSLEKSFSDAYSLYFDVDVVGVAAVEDAALLNDAGAVIKAMRKQYGENVSIEIMTLDALEV